MAESQTVEYATYEQHPLASTFAGALRFGRTNDVSLVFGDDGNDYLMGLAFMGVTFVAIFVLWILFVITMRCLGARRVGFFSGQPFRRVIDDQEFIEQQELLKAHPDDSVFKDYHEGISLGLRTTRVRLCFLLSGVVFIAFSILSVTNGLTNLQSTVDTVHHNALIVDELTHEAQDILESIKGIRETAVRIKDVLVAELEGDNFCPGNANIQLEEAAEIVQQANDAIPLLNQLETFAGSDMDEIEDVAFDMQTASQNVKKETDSVELTSWQALVIMIPFTLVPALLMSGAILALFDVEFPWFTCMLNWAVFPLFFSMVLFACFFTSLMVVVAGANADFCLPKDAPGEPTVDTSIIRIVEASGFDPTTMEYRIARFYTSACTVDDDPFLTIADIEPKLTEAGDTLNSFQDQLNDEASIIQLELYCNRDFDVIRMLLVDIVEIIQVLKDAVSRTLRVAECETIVPIYTSVAYEATCNYSISALVWIFVGMLTVSIFGLLMLTLRSSYKHTRYMTLQEALEERPVKELDDSDDEYPAEYNGDDDDLALNRQQRGSVEDYALRDDDSNSNESDDEGSYGYSRDFAASADSGHVDQGRNSAFDDDDHSNSYRTGIS